MIDILSPELGYVVYRLGQNTRVYRFEPRNISTPMTPHASPYAPYGRWEFGHKHLFVAEEQALGDLEDLRRGQGYFEQDVILRTEVLGSLVRRCGSGTAVLVDVKFNMTVLGAERRGGLIIAMPITNMGA